MIAIHSARNMTYVGLVFFPRSCNVFLCHVLVQETSLIMFVSKVVTKYRDTQKKTGKRPTGTHNVLSVRDEFQKRELTQYSTETVQEPSFLSSVTYF